MVLRLDSLHSERRFAEGPAFAQDTAAPPDQTSARDTSKRLGTVDRPSRHSDPTSRTISEADAYLNRLQALGWIVEMRDCYRLARLEHRQILLFNDGRIVFKDPTIRGRHQCDAEWLKVSAFMWPDTSF